MMRVSCFTKKIGKGFGKPAFCAAVSALLFSAIGMQAEASKCYHHYFPQSWEGKGTAIVFCKNSGEVYGGRPMATCEVWNRETDKKIMDFVSHDQTDHGRQVMTDYDTKGTIWGRDNLVIICRGVNGRYYSYEIPNASAYVDPGVCSPNSGYIGSSSVCQGDSDPLLRTRKAGKGKGTVRSNVKGYYAEKINCTTGCSSDSNYFFKDLNQKVTLTATPAKGNRFAGWTGDCSGTGNCVVTMNAAKTVTARFEPMAVTGAIGLMLKNDIPVATPQSVTTAYETPVDITLAGDDSDGTISDYTIVSGPSHGALTGTYPDLTYQPTIGYAGPDFFTFTVTDNEGRKSVPATVSITVSPAT